jgi:hypothetical protein
MDMEFQRTLDFYSQDACVASRVVPTFWSRPISKSPAQPAAIVVI